MRNLKRVLSLTLASVMLLGMMVIGSSAAEVTKIDFTDAGDIEYTEAVDVMVALGILEGTGKGDFQPKATLTREAAAKIVCYMLLGKENAEKLTANKAVFLDVAANRWSAGYISYCVERGILAGTGDGNFLPTGELTGVAFGKMLLVALGYDPVVQQYTGGGWALSVAADMVDAGIAPSGVLLNAPMTREQAAQTAFQTLTADVVRYTQKPVTITNADGSTVVINASEAQSVTTGAGITSDNYAGSTATDDGYGTQQFCEKYFPKLKLDSTSGVKDDFQRHGSQWNYDGNKICFSADDATLTYTKEVKLSDIYKDLGKPSVTAASYLKNGYTATATNTTTVNDTNLKNSDEKVGGNGTLIEVYKDGTTVTIIGVETYLAKATDDYDKDDEELKVEILSDNTLGDLTGIITLSSDDVAGLAAFAEDDYVLITATTSNGSNYTVQTAEAPEIFVGQVSRYTTGSNVTVNGTKYEYAEGVDGTPGSMTYTINDSDYEVVVDKYGYILSIDGKSNDSYLYINEIANDGPLTVSSKKIADAFTVDGERMTIQVKKVNAANGSEITDFGEDTSRVQGWFSYTVKNNEYTLTKLNTSTKATAPAVGTPGNGATIVTNDAPAVNGKTGTNDTVYVLLNGDDVKLYTGYKNVPTVTAGDNACISTIYNDKGYAEYVFINAGDNATVSGGSTSDLVFILKAPDENKDDDGTFYTYKAIVNGAVVDEMEATDKLSSLVQGLYKDPTYDGDRLDNASQVRVSAGDYVVKPSINGTVTEGSGIVTISGDATYKVTADCDIKVISADGEDVDSYTPAQLAKKYASTNLAGVLYGVKDKDDNYSVLYIHVGGADPTPSSEAVVTLSASFEKGDESNTGTVASVNAELGTAANAQKIYVTFGAITNTLSNTAGKVDTIVVTGTTSSAGAEMVAAHSSITLSWNGTGWTADTTNKNNTIQVKAEDGTVVEYTFDSAKSTDASLTAAYGSYTDAAGGDASGNATVEVKDGKIVIKTNGITNAATGDSFTVALTKGFSKATMTDDAATPNPISSLTISTTDGTNWTCTVAKVTVTPESGDPVDYDVAINPAS